jgi:hypothetical protein
MKDSYSRRTFLSHGLAGLGGLALGNLLLRENCSAAATSGFLDLSPHFLPKVKRVIHLCMAGGPSHLETFDYKSMLRELDGQPMPESFTTGQQLAQLQGSELRCLGAQYDFETYGKSGMQIGNILPHIGSVADDIAVVRSMFTEQINHDPAHTFMNTGSIIPGRASMGSWVLYGLGSISENLPGYVVLTSAGGGEGQPISSRQWHNGILPGNLQGVEFQSAGDPVHYVSNPAGVSTPAQRDLVDTVNRINSIASGQSSDPEIATRIEQYELAFRMQASVPDLMDASNEPQSILDLYGCTPGDGSFASNCLLARRLAERGVRFIQLYHRGWDHHNNLKKDIAEASRLVDQPTAALIKDLKLRGMLDDTLIIWGGEFGRTPMAQPARESGNWTQEGRDHHIKAFSIFLCGGGIKGGTTYGDTDELGYGVVSEPTSVHDLHATMLHLLGIDHERLTFKSQGLDMRLTGVEHANVLHEILV